MLSELKCTLLINKQELTFGKLISYLLMFILVGK